MKPETTQALRNLLLDAVVDHAAASTNLRYELDMISKGRPTPPPAKTGRSTHDLIARDKKRAALRGLIAAVALEGREVSKFGLGVADCFNRNSQAISYAHGLRLIDIFPGLSAAAAPDIESALESKGVHFKARRIVALMKPKG